jgi:hypothetical protein
MGEERNVYRLLVAKPEGWIGNIKMDFLEIGLGGVDWIVLARDRWRWRALVNTVMKL